MRENIAYLGLGSNLGDRWANLKSVVRLLNAPNQGVRVIRSSRVYETEPWGLAGQPRFLNCALQAATSLPPFPLLRRLKEVEDAVGRKPGPRYGPRVADLDILLYGGLTLDETAEGMALQVPHPRLHLRSFALVPLAELVPEYVHPLLDQTIGSLAQKVDGLEGLTLLGPLPVSNTEPHD